jgi:DNA/RNA-binding protein KIN17
MPKAEKGTPKDLANKMKAKGLQKLRWYCQMCQKQCRDENGFKCHTTSETHQRQLLIFADNPNKYLDEFSKEFSDGFVELLRRRFGTKRIYANQVYQEYISDRNHLHMNATRWLSLTEYVKYLGREGICTVDETEKGWYITWIDRDPETIARQQADMKKQKMDKDDEERKREFIMKQIERAKATKEESSEPQYTELKRASEDEKVVGKFDIKQVSKVQPVSASTSVFKDLKRRDDDSSSMFSFKSNKSEKRKMSALEEIKLEEERRKKKRMEKEIVQDTNWITEGLVVKVVTKELGDKYYKQKGTVLQVVDRHVAIIKLLETGGKLKLDEAHLETVIPALGRKVKILKGKHKGSTGVLRTLHEDQFCVDVEIREGPWDGKVVRQIPYEDICKISSDS